MNDHVSVTIDRDTLKAARRHAAEQRRSLSNLVEFALSFAMSWSGGVPVVTTAARYDAIYSREDSCGER